MLVASSVGEKCLKRQKEGQKGECPAYPQRHAPASNDSFPTKNDSGCVEKSNGQKQKTGGKSKILYTHVLNKV